ncbi:MAG: hypothetical protein ACRDKE_06350 [Solirubrobacterales bacterium]
MAEREPVSAWGVYQRERAEREALRSALILAIPSLQYPDPARVIRFSDDRFNYCLGSTLRMDPFRVSGDRPPCPICGRITPARVYGHFYPMHYIGEPPKIGAYLVEFLPDEYSVDRERKRMVTHKIGQSTNLQSRLKLFFGQGARIVVSVVRCKSQPDALAAEALMRAIVSNNGGEILASDYCRITDHTLDLLKRLRSLPQLANYVSGWSE